jgi:hypothetical protein
MLASKTYAASRIAGSGRFPRRELVHFRRIPDHILAIPERGESLSGMVHYERNGLDTSFR